MSLQKIIVFSGNSKNFISKSQELLEFQELSKNNSFSTFVCRFGERVYLDNVDKTIWDPEFVKCKVEFKDEQIHILSDKKIMCIPYSSKSNCGCRGCIPHSNISTCKSRICVFRRSPGSKHVVFFAIVENKQEAWINFWSGKVKEEFIKLTWHPDRVLAGWCLDEDERKERLEFYGC